MRFLLSICLIVLATADIDARGRLIGGRRQTGSAPSFAGSGPYRGASAEPLYGNHDHLRQFFPRGSAILDAIRDNPGLIFYGERSMPRAYQFGGGIHSAYYNISAGQPSEPFGNMNREFPWNTTAGMDNASNGRVLNFVLFPKGGKIRYWTDGELWRWQYPEDTVFGEILLVTDPEGVSYPFEVRTRTRTMYLETPWRVNVHRPFASAADLIAEARRLEPGNVALAQYAKVSTLNADRFANRHPRKVVDRVALVDEVPDLGPALTRKLLDRPFVSVLNSEWVTASGANGEMFVGYSPTTRADFGIVPKGYRAHALTLDSKSCMACHTNTGKSVNEFESRDWYGHCRGSDGIFSFHIFEPSCISGNGFRQQVVFRRELADLLEPWQ